MASRLHAQLDDNHVFASVEGKLTGVWSGQIDVGMPRDNPFGHVNCVAEPVRHAEHLLTGQNIMLKPTLRLGKEIVQVDVRQEPMFTDNPTVLPLCITLTFGPEDRVYICAAQYFDEDDLLFIGGDEIVIFFRDDMVRRYYPDLLAR